MWLGAGWPFKITSLGGASQIAFYRVRKYALPSHNSALGLHGPFWLARAFQKWNFARCFRRWCSPSAVRLARTFQKLQFCEAFLKVVLTKCRKGCTGCQEIAILRGVFEVNVNVTGKFTATYQTRRAVPGKLDYLKSGLGYKIPNKRQLCSVTGKLPHFNNLTKHR